MLNFFEKEIKLLLGFFDPKLNKSWSKVTKPKKGIMKFKKIK